MDRYSFGVVLWEVSVRKKPFAGMMPHQVMAAVGFNGQQLPRPVTAAEKSAEAASATTATAPPPTSMSGQNGVAVAHDTYRTPSPQAVDVPPKLVEIMYHCMDRELRERPGFDVVLDELELLHRALVQGARKSKALPVP